MIRVLLDNSEFAVLENPDPRSKAWQWVSLRGALGNSENLTVQLALQGMEYERAYFDDLCVSFSPVESGELININSKYRGGDWWSQCIM